MIMSISSAICNHIVNVVDMSADDREKMLYSLQNLIGEFSKILLMFLFFLPFNLHGYFLRAVLALAIIRMYTGGLHFKTYGGCLMFSLTFFSARILLTKFCVLPQLGYLLVGLIGLIVIGLISPITSKSRPNYSIHQRRTFKTMGCLIISLHLLGCLILKNNPYFISSVWVILLQAIQLILAKEVENHEKKVSF